MKKLLIGLLVIAAGAGVFFYLQNKKQSSTENTIQKELLTGKWKLDTLIVPKKDSSVGFSIAFIGALDSNFMNYRYDVRKDGKIFLLVDSVFTDTSYYEWNKTNELLWKDEPADTVSETFSVIKLTDDSLILHSKDSIGLFFTKLK